MGSVHIVPSVEIGNTGMIILTVCGFILCYDLGTVPVSIEIRDIARRTHTEKLRRNKRRDHQQNQINGQDFSPNFAIHYIILLFKCVIIYPQNDIQLLL